MICVLCEVLILKLMLQIWNKYKLRHLQIDFCKKNDLNYIVIALGPLCLWQCLFYNLFITFNSELARCRPGGHWIRQQEQSLCHRQVELFLNHICHRQMTFILYSKSNIAFATFTWFWYWQDWQGWGEAADQSRSRKAQPSVQEGDQHLHLWCKILFWYFLPILIHSGSFFHQSSQYFLSAQVDGDVTAKRIYFEVMDKDTFTKDDLIGEVIFSLNLLQCCGHKSLGQLLVL